MIAGTCWSAVRQPQGRRFVTTRERLVERCRTPIVTADKLTLPGWAPTTFVNDYRRLANVEQCFAVGVDLDGGGTNLDADAEVLGDLCGFIYSSHSHTPERQRGRAILWGSRPIAPLEYTRCWRWVVQRLPTAGQEAKDASRLWFVPGVQPGAEYRLIELTGALLDVDQALAEVSENPPIGGIGQAGATRGVAAPVVPVDATTDVIERARRYLECCDVAVSGQGGHRTTFVVAMKLVRGFRLDPETAYALLTDWNQRCEPPWSERELRRKVSEAAKYGGMPAGKLLEAST